MKGKIIYGNRGSGKTTELLKRAKDAIEWGYEPVLIARNSKCFDNELLKRNNIEPGQITVYSSIQSAKEGIRGRDIRKIKVLIDELPLVLQAELNVIPPVDFVIDQENNTVDVITVKNLGMS